MRAGVPPPGSGVRIPRSRMGADGSRCLATLEDWRRALIEAGLYAKRSQVAAQRLAKTISPDAVCRLVHLGLQPCLAIIEDHLNTMPPRAP